MTGVSEYQNTLSAYCSLQIEYVMRERNKATKEEVLSFPGLPHEQVSQHLRNAQQEWEASEACKQLRSTLQSVTQASEVRKIVAFALSTIAIDEKGRSIDRSLFQHALVLTLHDVFAKAERSDESSLHCYAQDPLYTDIDQSVLNENGITILNDPEGFLQVDENSVVVSCCSNVPVKQIVCDLARPAVIIWDRILDEDPEYSMWAELRILSSGAG